MEFIEAPAFTRHLLDYLDDKGYRELQAKLGANADLGDLMPGTGGFRKMRWADARRGKGRRGGLRIIYYHFKSDSQIWLMTLYGKDEAFGPDSEREEGAQRRNRKRIASACGSPGHRMEDTVNGEERRSWRTD